LKKKYFTQIELRRKKQARKMRKWRAKNPRPYNKIELTLNGKKLSAQVSQLKQSSADSLVELATGINKWKKDPNSRNWVDVFRMSQTDSGNIKQTTYSKYLRDFLQGNEVPKTTKVLFNQLKIKEALNLSAKETSQIESYTAKLFASERPAEATEATRKN
jgi:hypothetical protein